jgi:aspartate/methionine/tyrosine aminotransferase
VSVLSIPLDGLIDPHLVHVTYGMSKDFSCNGMRLGVFVTQHNPGAYTAMASLSLFAWPSSPAMELWTRMLNDRAWLDSYLEENSKRLTVYYKRAVQWLESNNIDYVKGGSAYLLSNHFPCYRS